MAFIGNTVQTQGFAPAIDYFSGNGSTVTFTLSRPIASVAQVICAIDNVIQNPSSSFTVSGNSITFTSAPLSGTNNIWVEYTSLITTYNAISQSPSVIGDITTSGGFFAQGTFGNTYIDGTVVDYVTGNGRLTVGSADGFTIYNGGTSARTALMTLDSSGNMGIGTTSPASKLDVANTFRVTYSPNTAYYGSLTNPNGNTLLYANGDSAALVFGTTVVGGSTAVEAARLNTYGNFVLKGGTTNANGVGITFPATQSASTDPNTLDDYEEGTWTPIVTPQSGSLTSYTSYGKYTKVGNLVVAYMTIYISNKGTAAGQLNFAGLPFTTFTTTGVRTNIFLARETYATGNIYQGFTNNATTSGNIVSTANGAVDWTTGVGYEGTAYYMTA